MRRLLRELRGPREKEISAARKLLVFLVLMGGLGTASVAVADPNLGTVPPHRHFIQTASGELVQVGPRVCDDPSLQEAFNQFHANIHSHTTLGGGTIGAIGPVAPGLHNGVGGELTPRPCSFTG